MKSHVLRAAPTPDLALLTSIPLLHRHRLLGSIQRLVLCALLSSFFTQTLKAAELLASDWQIMTPQQRQQACEENQPYCLCHGRYQEPPRVDLGLSSPDPAALFAAANNYSINEQGVAELKGNAILQQQDMQVESETVTLDRKNNLLTIEGQARFRQTDFLLLGERAEINLESKDAHFSEAKYLTHSKGLRGDANEIQIKGNGGLIIKDGSYTSCEPNDNTWHLQGNEISLDRESGWGTAKHMTLNVKNIPIFYSPYFKFPIDDKRHTGFLYPRFNVRKPDLATPYYINIAPNYDATLTPRRIGRHGEMLEGQFRYLTPMAGLGEINFGFLINDSELNYEDRKLFNWTQTSRWNERWSGEVDVNYISDNEYFDDFDSEFSIQSISHIERKAALFYNDANWQFSTRVQSYQTVDDLVLPSTRPYRRLPEIRLKGDQLLIGTPSSTSQIHWINRLEYVYFEQQFDINAPYAHRVNLNTAIEWRLRWTWGHLIQSARFQHTHYRLSGDLNANQKERDLSAPISSLDGGLIFERAFSIHNKPWIQTLEPRLFYVKIPLEEQADIPLFDTSALTFGYNQLFRENRFSGGDRLGDTDQLSVGLTTRFIDSSQGREILTLSAGQILYFKDRHVQLEENTTEVNSLERSAIAVEISARLNARTRLSSGAVWKEEINTLENASFTAEYKVSDKQHWNLGYRYRVKDTSDRIAQADLLFSQKINHNWRFTGLWHFDLENNSTVEQMTGLVYESCCWNSSFVYRRKINNASSDEDARENDYGFFIEIELKDLSGIKIEI